MSTESRLQRDLTILAAMAEEMSAYLDSDVLFWPMMKSGMPQLTLGGYLMRQHHLLALAPELDSESRMALNQAVSNFNQALAERVVRFEAKAQRELEARIRQWGEFLRDLAENRIVGRAGYATAVEARAMIEALVDKLHVRPFKLPDRIMPRIDQLDRKLRSAWEPGEFVWSDELQPAYPQADYWWLYGLPRKDNSRS